MRRVWRLARASRRLEQLGAAPLEQLEAGRGLEVAGEGDPQREGAVVADVGVRQQLDEPGAPGVGDAVHLLAAAGALHQAALPDAGPEGGQLAGQRAGHRGAGHGGALLDGLHAALGLEAGEGGVERAEADGGAAGEQLTEPLLELVAVELLLREQAEDGEVDHEGWWSRRYIVLMYRFDATTECTAGGQMSTPRRP